MPCQMLPAITAASSPVTSGPGCWLLRDIAPPRTRCVFHQQIPRQPEAMMSSASDHHAQAERLLEQARAEQDSIRRAVILAEAQVHATLALSAGTGTARPGPGRGEASDTRRTGQYHPLGTP